MNREWRVVSSCVFFKGFEVFYLCLGVLVAKREALIVSNRSCFEILFS